jgi:hypothetical protein
MHADAVGSSGDLPAAASARMRARPGTGEDSPVADVGYLPEPGWAGVQRVVHKVAAVLADPAQAQRREQLRQPGHIVVIIIIIIIIIIRYCYHYYYHDYYYALLQRRRSMRIMCTLTPTCSGPRHGHGQGYCGSAGAHAR